jgi:3-hydroxyisobutyrate dehydrogenase-like beta-hydroxyacid dehydrogenase
MAAPLERVSVVGLGHMGTAIAERVLAGTYPLLVFNRSPGRDSALVSAGAARLASLEAALVEADISLTSLPDDDAVESALCGPRGILAAARRGTVLVETSTISVAASEKVAEAAAEHDVHYLRAPISGNPAALRSGAAAVFVSGRPDVVDACRPLLEQIAPTVHYVGEGERARVIKLVLQVMIGGTAGLLAEALVLGEAAGLERKTLLEAIGSSVVGSRFIEYKTGPLLRDDYSSTFTTAMMTKDVELILDLADSGDAALPLTRELRAVLESASEHGHADDDFSSLLVELKERSAGIETATKDR